MALPTHFNVTQEKRYVLRSLKSLKKHMLHMKRHTRKQSLAVLTKDMKDVKLRRD